MVRILQTPQEYCQDTPDTSGGSRTVRILQTRQEYCQDPPDTQEDHRLSGSSEPSFICPLM